MKKILLVLFLFSLIPVGYFLLKNQETKLISVNLRGKENSISYQVEIANTPEKAQTGLMWRKSMPQDQGMLFIFPYPKITKMWMKNTYIPLDMIFFNAQGQVICLHENAHPLDETIISCPYPAKMVLELNAGEIKAKNIQLGDFLF